MKEKVISRRDFIDKSSLVTAGIAVGINALASPSVLGTNELLHYDYREPWKLLGFIVQ